MKHENEEFIESVVSNVPATPNNIIICNKLQLVDVANVTLIHDYDEHLEENTGVQKVVTTGTVCLGQTHVGSTK